MKITYLTSFVTIALLSAVATANVIPAKIAQLPTIRRSSNYSHLSHEKYTTYDWFLPSLLAGDIAEIAGTSPGDLIAKLSSESLGLGKFQTRRPIYIQLRY